MSDHGPYSDFDLGNFTEASARLFPNPRLNPADLLGIDCLSL